MPQDDRWVSTICWNCVEGPDAIRVHVVDGVAVNLEGNVTGPGFAQNAKGRGCVCPKAFSLVQKLYNPYRIKGPLKRTNAKKGRGEDPGFVEISWDEALGMVASRLGQIRSVDTNKVSRGPGGPQMNSQSGTWDAFFRAYGPTQYLASGGSIRCDMVEHVFGNQMHGGFQCEPDLAYCKYLILVGLNTSASGGAPETVLYSEARARGMKIVLVDPVFSPTASKADQWIPIKPGTDLAFLLALINVILHELGKYDSAYLKSVTNSPYLVGGDGFFARDRSGKVLVWDQAANRARPYDDPALPDPALEGRYIVGGQEVRPAFQVLKDHVASHTPEWAEGITEIPAGMIRVIAREYIEAAQIGSTVQIDGLTLPLRPVGIKMGRGVSGQTRAYQCALAQHILAILVGGLEVPGGHGGGSNSVGARSNIGVTPGPDGLVKMDTYPFTWPPVSYSGAETLTPYAKVYALGHPRHLAYRHLLEPPRNFPLPPLPEAYIRYRSNPLTAVGEPEVVFEALRRIPFIVSFSYLPDEVTQLADVVFPEHLDLERYDLASYIRGATATKFEGRLLRQPVVKPVHNTMEMSDIFTELASRMGFLDGYNTAINDQFRLADPFRLEPGKKYTWTEIVDRLCLSNSAGEHNLEWFSENGGFMKPVSGRQQYDVHLAMVEQRMRYSLPYMEHVKKTGVELARNLKNVGVDWWPTEEYVALPTYFPSVLAEVPREYDFYVTTGRSAQFYYGSNMDAPWLSEASELAPGQTDVIMNVAAARARGIKDGDEVWVESEVGKVKRKAKLTQCIRPDTVLIVGQFGQWATPVSRDTGRVSLTTLTPIRPGWTDHVVSNMQGQTVKAKVYRATSG